MSVPTTTVLFPPPLPKRLVSFDPSLLIPPQGPPQPKHGPGSPAGPASPSTPKQLGGLKHLSYQCEGFSGAQGKLDIRARPLRALVSLDHPIVIPAFQRKFCWTVQQATQWWGDASRPTREGCLHTVGKLFVKKQDGVYLLIDGQQRVTTLLLLLASLRDAALDFIPGTAGKELADRIDELIFFGSGEPEFQAAIQRLAMQCAGAASFEFGKGEVFAGCRLVPSYADRAAFYSLILFGRVRRAGGAGCDLTALRLSAAVTDSLQAAAKTVFDTMIRKQLSEWLTAGEATDGKLNSLSRCAGFLSGVLGTLLNGMSMVYAEILNDVRLAQVFLWLQEKSLFGMGALLYNPAPGVQFAASDLVRNLLLAPFMSESLDTQERFHLEHWVHPIELPLCSPSSIDRTLRRFLRGRRTAYRSELEQQLDGLIATMARGDTRKPSQGMELYVNFYSFFEERLLMATAAADAAEQSSSLEQGEQRVALSLLQELAGFVAADARSSEKIEA